MTPYERSAVSASPSVDVPGEQAVEPAGERHPSHDSPRQPSRVGLSFFDAAGEAENHRERNPGGYRARRLCPSSPVHDMDGGHPEREDTDRNHVAVRQPAGPSRHFAYQHGKERGVRNQRLPPIPAAPADRCASSGFPRSDLRRRIRRRRRRGDQRLGGGCPIERQETCHNQRNSVHANRGCKRAANARSAPAPSVSRSMK